MELKLLELVFFVSCVALGSCFLLPEEQMHPQRSGGRMTQQRRANELAKLLQELKTRKDKRNKLPLYCLLWPEETTPSIISRSKRHPHSGLSSILRKIVIEEKRKRTAMSGGGRTADCRVDPFERLRCGTSDLSSEECSAMGCCWHALNLEGVPWCFHSVSNSHGSCKVDPGSRSDCGYYGVTSDVCRQAGCCWSPTQVVGAPWCFHSSDEQTGALGS